MPTAYAQDSSQLHLPEGAIARFGKGGINDIAYSPDGKQLAVASSAGIYLYDANTGTELSLLTGNTAPIYSIVYSPVGGTIAGIGHLSSEVHLWDIVTGQHRIIQCFFWVTGIAYSPAGGTIAVAGDTWGNDKAVMVNLYNVVTSETEATFAKHPGFSRSGIVGIVNSLAYSPDGGTIAVSRSTMVDLYDVVTGEIKSTLTGVKEKVIKLVYSPDGGTIATGGRWGSVQLWDSITGRVKATLDRENNSSFIYSLAYSPDGGTIAIGDSRGSVQLWDSITGRVKATLDGERNGSIHSLAYSPDGGTIATGDRGGSVQLWDSITGHSKFTLLNDHRVFYQVTYSPNGETLVSGGSDNTVCLWDAATGIHRKTLTGHRLRVKSIAFSPDGETLASGSSDGTVRLWDGVNGNHLETLRYHGEVWALAFSPDSRTIAAGGCRNDTISLWDVTSGEHRKSLKGHTTAFRSIAFSPDGRTIAAGGGYGGEEHICLWDFTSGQHRKALEGNVTYFNLAFSPDGRTLACKGQAGIQLWNPTTGAARQTIQVDGAYNLISLVFSPDGKTLASGHRDGTIHLSDIATGQQLKSFNGHGRVESLSFSPDSSTLASVTGGVLFLWDVTAYILQQPQPDSQHSQRDSVRLVYFRPSDRTAQRGIDTHLTTLIKDVQDFYAAQLHRHGRKTFIFETDVDGNPVVHHVDGKFTDAYYQQHTYERVQKEIEEQFDSTKHVYLVAVDVSSETVNDGVQGEVCGTGGGSWHSTHGSESWKRNSGGLAVIPASGACFNVGVTAHELGHAFGLEHDFRDETYLMGYGSQSRLSVDATEWLSVHRYFNTGQTDFDQDTTLMVVSARASGLKFEVSDADGLHQVQLLIPVTASDSASGVKLHSSEGLNGQTDGTVTFAVPELTGNSEVTLQVIDMNGGITKQKFTVETDSITEVPEATVNGNVARVSLSPASVWSGNVGDQLAVNANITEGVDVRGYQLELTFDTAALRFVSSVDAGYLPAGAFQVPPVENVNRVTFGATSLQASSEGDGTLATFTFEVLAASPAMPTLTDVKLTDSNADFLAVQIGSEELIETRRVSEDVNGDGVVNIQDLVVVASSFGQTGQIAADVTGDGIVNIADLVKVAGAIGTVAAAPSMNDKSPDYNIQVHEMLTGAEVQRWLTQAQQLDVTDATVQKGIYFLEQLLEALAPTETALLPNYPNPFNPETWIPYHLSKPADVRISIHAADGRLVRMLTLGHQGAGIYASRSRAAYWNGRNALGEPVASGVYFYTFTAGEFTATRKMLIRK